MRLATTSCLAAMVVFACGPGLAAGQSAPRVAVVADGPSDLIDSVTGQIAAEVDALLATRYPGYRFPRVPTHVGDYTPQRAKALVAQALTAADVDIVVGVGVLVGRAIGATKVLRKPTFLPFASPVIEGLPRAGATSGQKNLAYIEGFIDLEQELRRFRDVMRRDRAVLLFDQVFVEHVPQLTALVEAAGKSGMQLRLQGVQASSEEILRALPADVQAVYIGPLLRLPATETQALIDGLNHRRLPTYASQGRDWVELGAFTTVVAGDSLDRRARRMALMIEETLDGADPATFRTVLEPREQLLINMATARAIGVSPSFALLTEAELLGADAAQRGPVLSLREAVGRALQTNLNMKATRLDADIATQQVREARGSLLPALDATGSFNWLDPDAANSFFNAERTLSWGLTGQQVVYSPRAWAGFHAAKANLGSVEHGIRAVELDLVRDTAQAYLNVLRARTAEAIQRSNLNRIRQNLTMAEARVSVGSATRQEVYRWQIEIAQGRANVIAASAQRNQAEIALNRFLNRPLEDPFQVAEPTDPKTGIVIDDDIRAYIDDPASFRLFRGFLAEEALRNAPELPQLERAIEAQASALTGQERALFVPDLVVSGGLTHTLLRDGEGSEDQPGLARDDFTWQVGAGLNFRLFDDGRYGEIDRSKAALMQLETQRAAVAQAIGQRVRSALHQAGATNAAVALQQDAADAAAENLKMVSDAYQQGAIDLITLVDAQDRALQTRLAAANAVYDFLLDFIEVQRAVGSFGFLSEPAEQQDFATRLSRYVAAARRGLGRRTTPDEAKEAQ